MTARIPKHEFEKLTHMVAESSKKSADITQLIQQLDIPEITSTNLESAQKARDCLKEIFFTKGYTILDVVVALSGHGPVSDSDTHYRGRVMEGVLGGSFTAKSQPDFAYGDLKLIETVADHVLSQILTVGVIFNSSKRGGRKNGEYQIVDNYHDSAFYKKVRQAVIMSYRKEGKQLGMKPDNIFVFEADNKLWADKLKQDWESIRDEMKNTILELKNGTKTRKASGICKSDTLGTRRPNGYLGIRSDGVIFTKAFFEIISRHYAANK